MYYLKFQYQSNQFRCNNDKQHYSILFYIRYHCSAYNLRIWHFHHELFADASHHDKMDTEFVLTYEYTQLLHKHHMFSLQYE